jgi:xanthine dehydrogenase accessory factor
VLATVVRCEAPTSARPGDKAVITPDGRLRGWVGGSCSEPLVKREALRSLEDGQPRLVQIVGGSDAVEQRSRPGELRMATTCPSGGSLDIFVEPRLPQPLLIVFGGAPAAQLLVRMASMTGFRTCAVHPGARADDFVDADLVLSDFDLTSAAIGADAAAVVVTMGHYDEDALEAALAYPQLDITLVASERRAAAVRQVLLERGVDEAKLARVRAPAGSRRGVSQAEIALFALADVVAAGHNRTPLRASTPAPLSSDHDEFQQARFATDPVCGMTVELPARQQALYQGETYSFCCEACRVKFEAEPTRFLAGVEQR